MMTLMTWTKTQLRYVPNVVAFLGLDFTLAVIATMKRPRRAAPGPLSFLRG